MERKLRRFKQLLPLEESIDILTKGKVCVLAVAGDNGFPYAVPVNYLFHDNSVYIHSALQGHKIDAMTENPKCSICVIDRDDVVPEEFTSYFRSVIAFGEAEFIKEDSEKIRILKLLSAKYSPGIDPTEEISKFLKNVCIIKIRIYSITGKEAIELTRMR